ncbi:flagellar export chaperone FliS [Nitrospirillum amazonense]|uniref:Flagellin-specific chaperone FliS n=1 Tax=Nitrospirillum amazonense TaxID=28077 RepID=A0A560KGL8_9PROT|nr:flagellar protein FliS [Nitrospirillum amazonense]MDG3443406.1 flagellar protein FliS [Nitrospirillum amazonense]TWB82455.1 flagellin-specific chaperone FliS [Nitrospirillum amazonense]
MNHTAYQRASSAYGSAKQTLPPHKLVEALQDRALQLCTSAERHATAGQFDRFHADIVHAIRIYTGLQVVMTNQVGGPSGKALSQLYGAFILALGRAAGGRDVPGRVRRIQERLALHRRLWAKPPKN